MTDFSNFYELIEIGFFVLTEFEVLAKVHGMPCVSIYLPTTPLSQNIEQSRIEFRGLIKQAQSQLDHIGCDKRLISSLSEHLGEIADDDDFWAFQANSLGVLATSESTKVYRLANTLTATVQVSDRFHLKPLLRSITFPNSAFVLALSENDCRLVEVSGDLPARTVRIDGLPKSAAQSAGTANINSRSASGRIQGNEGQNVRLRQYARKVEIIMVIKILEIIMEFSTAITMKVMEMDSKMKD